MCEFCSPLDDRSTASYLLSAELEPGERIYSAEEVEEYTEIERRAANREGRFPIPFFPPVTPEEEEMLAAEFK